jgi:sortase A
MRWKNLILIFAALATAFVLTACSSSGQSKGDGGKQAKQENAQEQETPKRQPPNERQVAPKQGPKKSAGGIAAVKPPSNDMMRLTVPQMKRLRNDKIPTGIGTDERLFHDYAGVHLKYTGFPWQKVANVYIAGHRLGFKNTDSWLAFDDLNKLKKGDKFYITDSEGRKYTYEVFRRFIAKPGNLSVLNPVKGKNIVTLQSCTKPDYVNRFLVQGELKDIKKT